MNLPVGVARHGVDETPLCGLSPLEIGHMAMIAMMRCDAVPSVWSAIAACRALSGQFASSRQGFEAYSSAAPKASKPAQKHGFGSGAKKKAKPGEDDVTPKLQKIVEMLLPPEQQSGPGGASVRDNLDVFLRRERAHAAKLAAVQAAWERDMHVKLKLQRAAIRALPAELRALAEQPDLAEFPPNRHLLFETPPESYRRADKDQQNNSTGTK